MILKGLLLLHGFFHLMMFGLLYKTMQELKYHQQSESVVKDEILFSIAQYIGILCGLLGLWLNCTYIQRQITSNTFIMILPFYLLILMPYGLIVFSWFNMKFKEKPSDWYDEKQWKDVSRAGLTTLFLSIPGMGILLLMKQSHGIFWFSHYMFLILLLFSGTTLYFTKKR